MLSRKLQSWRTQSGHALLRLVLIVSFAVALAIALVLLFHQRWKLFITFACYVLVMPVCGVLYRKGHILLTTALYHGVCLVGIIALMAFTGGVSSIVLPVIPVCVMSCFAILPKHGEQIGTTLAVVFIVAYSLLVLVPKHWNEMPGEYVPNGRIVLLVFSLFCAVLVSLHSRKRSRRKKKVALEAALVAAERAEHTKNALIANISHELRTPINAALGAAELIILEPANSEEYADIIRKACNSLLIVINDVLVYSSLEKNTVAYEQAPVNLEQMLWDVLRVMMPLVSANLNLETAVSPEASALLRRYELIGDIVRIQQIISNLVNNAIKFTPQGQVLVMLQEDNQSTEESKTEKNYREENQPLVGLNKRSSPPVAPSRVWLTFLVKDTGIGIAKSKLQHIFDPFTQADEGISRMYGGTGLGLSISRKLARAMGGELTVESVLEEGSTFKVSLPFQAHLRRANSLPLKESFSAPSQSSLGKLPESPILMNKIRKIADSTPTTPDLSFRAVTSPVASTPALRRVTCNDAPLVEPKSEPPPLPPEPSSPSRESVVVPKHPVRQLAKLAGLVLLVDDTPINLKIVGRLLERLGMTVVTATNGLEAVEIAKQRGQEIVVVLMDVQMPICDGLTATRTIRALGEEKEYSYLVHLPIVALTANAMDSNREETAKAGMTGFLAKPVRLEVLESTIAPLVKGTTQDAVTNGAAESIRSPGLVNRSTVSESSFHMASPRKYERKIEAICQVVSPASPAIVEQLDRKLSISESVTPPPQAYNRRLSRKLSGLLILVSDDVKHSHRLLRRLGFHVLAVSNAADAIDLAKKHGANAVALLTSVDVAEITQSIRTASNAPELRFLHDLPIVELSETRSEASVPEVSGFLTTPLSVQAVEALLLPLIAGRHNAYTPA